MTRTEQKTDFMLFPSLESSKNRYQSETLREQSLACFIQLTENWILFSCLVLRRICTYSFRGWKIYVEILLNSGVYTLQMKGQWESNINVCFRFIYSQKWSCMASLFPKQNYNVLSPNFHIHVFPGSICLFCYSQIGRLILGIYKSLTDTWM